MRAVHLLAHPASVTPPRTPPRSAWRAGAQAAVAAVVACLAIRLVAAMAGAAFRVTPPGTADSVVVSVGLTLVTVCAAVLAGTGALLAVSRHQHAWPALAWLGLGIGLVSATTPLLADGDTTTRVALALMHLVTGAAWWQALRQHAPAGRAS